MSHRAVSTSLRRAPVSINSLIALALVQFRMDRQRPAQLQQFGVGQVAGALFFVIAVHPRGRVVGTPAPADRQIERLAHHLDYPVRPHRPRPAVTHLGSYL